MLLIPLIAALISSAYGASRYVIDDYVAPEPVGTRGWAYPLDLCVNILIQGDAPFNAGFGMYSCNQEGDTVTLTEYGADSTCTGDSTGTTDITDTSKFNCDGEDNYASFIACTRSAIDPPPPLGGKACCQEPTTSLITAGCLTTSLVTNLCYAPNGDANYTMTTCDGMGENTGIYTGDSSCANSIVNVSTSIDQCVYLDTLLGFYDAYRKMTVCVEDGTDLADDTYCPYRTGAPTIQPTLEPTTAEPTTEPTTNEPTEATSNPTTSAPTEEETGDKAAGLYVVSVLMAVIGFVIYME